MEKHQNDIVASKLRNNKSLTDPDYQHIEKLLWEELGTKDDYKKKFGAESIFTIPPELLLFVLPPCPLA